MKKILDGKTCFLTGASGGLGYEIAKELAKENCNLFLTGRNEKKLSELKECIKEINKEIKIHFEKADFNNSESIKQVINNSKNVFGNIDILINCAGFFVNKPLNQNSLEEFESSMNVNVKAPFMLSKEFSKGMIENNWGRIVNIGSSSSYSGFKNGTIYCSTKHAILGFSRALQNELKTKNIRTYCISPGSIKTEMGKISKDQNFDTFLNPKEIAKYIIFSISFDNELISDEIRLNRINLE